MDFRLNIIPGTAFAENAYKLANLGNASIFVDTFTADVKDFIQYYADYNISYFDVSLYKGQLSFIYSFRTSYIKARGYHKFFDLNDFKLASSFPNPNFRYDLVESIKFMEHYVLAYNLRKYPFQVSSYCNGPRHQDDSGIFIIDTILKVPLDKL